MGKCFDVYRPALGAWRVGKAEEFYMKTQKLGDFEIPIRPFHKMRYLDVVTEDSILRNSEVNE